MENSKLSLEERKFRWERSRFVVASIGGTVLFLIGLWQFTVTARNEFAKPVLQKQIDLCIEAADYAARLARHPDKGTPALYSQTEAQSFLALYWGKLGVIEDSCLYGAMVRFHNEVFGEETAIDAKGNPAGAKLNATDPNRLALTIAFACRRLISKNWSPGLVGLYDPQRLLDDFTDLPDFKETMNSTPGCEESH